MIETKTTMAREGDKVIAVLQRGWVVVGRYHQQGDIASLSESAVIRRWGTTKGLGEIASGGPIVGKTFLDPCPPVSFHLREVVMLMECDQNAWR
jgi:hypothetical protein